MSTYHNDTLRILDALHNNHLNIAEKDGFLVVSLTDTDFEAILPTNVDRASSILTLIQRPGENRKTLALRLNTDPSTLSTATSETRNRRFSRNIVLASILWIDPIPDPDEANHILMQMGRPGLFLRTYDNRENRRNWVLHSILTYAQSHPCPVNNWLEFANGILHTCGMHLINTRKKTLPPLPVITPHIRQLAEQWATESRQLQAVNFSIKRNHFFNRFCQERHYTGYGSILEAKQDITNQALVSISVVNDMLGAYTNKNSNIGRESLIPIAIAMNCSFREINQMLLEGNRALLYPNTSDEMELAWIRAMHRD